MCRDQNMGYFAGAQAGDVCEVWLDDLSPAYFHAGEVLLLLPTGEKRRSDLLESDLDLGRPFRYVFKPGELFVVSVVFDQNAPAGKHVQVNARVSSGSGTLRKEWCTRIVGGTPDPDWASFGVK